MQKNNTISNFNLDANPGHPFLESAGSLGNSISDRALQNVDYKQWAPRFGLAYSIDSKTVNPEWRRQLLLQLDYGGRYAVPGNQSAQQRPYEREVPRRKESVYGLVQS